MLLQQQYRERRFTKYSELISCLLLGEQNNAILLRNHQNRPTGSTPFPEANAATYNNFGRNRGRRDNRGHVRNHERVRGRGHGGKNNQWHRGENKKFYKNKSPHHLKWNNDKGASSSHYQARERKGKFVQNKRNSDDHDGPCFKCGMTNHWSRTCRTPKHLVELYEASMKGKGKGKEVEINFNVAEPLTQTNCVNETTHLDASDFFVNQGLNN